MQLLFSSFLPLITIYSHPCPAVKLIFRPEGRKDGRLVKDQIKEVCEGTKYQTGY
jgi:hypothetical protein